MVARAVATDFTQKIWGELVKCCEFAPNYAILYLLPPDDRWSPLQRFGILGMRFLTPSTDYG